VQYDGAEVPKQTKAPPRKVKEVSDDSEVEIPKIGRGKRANLRNGIETDYENVKPRNQAA
jgi:hypothetical protein